MKWCERGKPVYQYGRQTVLFKRRNFVYPNFTTKMQPLRVRSQSEEDVTIDNSTVLVVGGGGLGMEVVRTLAKAGSWVTVFQRSEKYRKDIEGLGAMLAIGDVMDPSTIEKALSLNTFDAVVCTVGGGTQNPNVDQDGCINVINAAKKAGVKRFLLVSSIGVGDSVVAVSEQTLQVLKVVLEAKSVAEQELKSSSLTYTIVRPGGLVPGPASGKGVLTEDPTVVGVITRGDVASLIKQMLFEKQAEFKTFSVIDSERLFPPTTSLEGIKIVSFA